MDRYNSGYLFAGLCVDSLKAPGDRRQRHITKLTFTISTASKSLVNGIKSAPRGDDVALVGPIRSMATDLRSAGKFALGAAWQCRQQGLGHEPQEPEGARSSRDRRDLRPQGGRWSPCPLPLHPGSIGETVGHMGRRNSGK
jgi:hypothetical protein